MMSMPMFLFSAGNLFDEVRTPQKIDKCLERLEIKNSLTPVQLYQSSATCIAEEKYTQAADLYLVAVAYGYFDTARVMDKTARDVLEILKMDNFGSLDVAKRDKFAQVLRNQLDNMRPMCQFLEILGKPGYHPRYMIEAGKEPNAHKSVNGLIPSYNASSLWQETRSQYLRCQ